MKKRIVFFLPIIFLIISCNSFETKKIDLLNSPMKILIEDYNVDSVYSLRLIITGYINGKAIIKLDDIKEIIVENNFVFEYGADWYSNEAIIYYEPIDCNQGKIKIKYQFFSL